MKLVFQNENWFTTEEATKTFEECTNLEDRSSFLFCYLRAICKSQNKQFEEKFLYKFAFMLADGVWESGLPYCNAEDFLSLSKNPFVAFLINAKSFMPKDNIYIPLLSILHNIADPFTKNDWIYTIDFKNKDTVVEKLKTLDHLFIDGTDLTVADPKVYQVEKNLEFLQLQIISLFTDSGMHIY